MLSDHYVRTQFPFSPNPFRSLPRVCDSLPCFLPLLIFPSPLSSISSKTFKVSSTVHIMLLTATTSVTYLPLEVRPPSYEFLMGKRDANSSNRQMRPMNYCFPNTSPKLSTLFTSVGERSTVLTKMTMGTRSPESGVSHCKSVERGG